jgi:hypothetical protein
MGCGKKLVRSLPGLGKAFGLSLGSMQEPTGRRL